MEKSYNDTSNTKTSTDSTSSKNTGESAPQQGAKVVNREDDRNPTNMEEFIDDDAQNRFTKETPPTPDNSVPDNIKPND